MPISAAQLALGVNYQLEAYSKDDPIDQIGQERPLLNWLLSKKKVTGGGNEYFNEKVRKSYDSNYQNYRDDQQVSYNRRDTVRLAKFPWASFHDGFGLNEDELARNGIILTDDSEAQMTDAEEVQIVNLLEENFTALKEGAQENFDLEVHLDGSQDPEAVVGLDGLISTTPAVGAVGGIDPALAANAYWRNNVNLAINTGTAGVLTAAMQTTWRACARYGKGGPPDFILAGSAFVDAYIKDATLTQNRQLMITGKGGTPNISASVGTGQVATGAYFNGVQIMWDPTFDTLDDLLGAITYPWKKRCYFLNSKFITLRPLQGHWMVNRKPPRVYDRYVHYWGLTSKYRITVKKRNAHAVLSIS